ncbi:glycosyl transferase [Rhodobacterales bacterium HKCCSP123]|nr:glycosyl transferase [Rhodobacterales bacterium HKCCSP123]
MIERIETYDFHPGRLAPGDRLPGVSAFMRIRNGADFLEATIRTHIDLFDEIVAVFNQCTDATPGILSRLAAEFGPKLRVYHYAPRVHPMGSHAHRVTPGSDPSSLVAYSNFALAMTRHQWAVKLDDDHLAIRNATGAMVEAIRMGKARDNVLHCFSGPNLVQDRDGRLMIPATDPVSGGGDIGYFRVSEGTHFAHDRRFERFERGRLERRFAGWFYWHLKFLKSGGGFANYELDANPESRYARKQERLAHSALWTLPEARRAIKPSATRRIRARIDEKIRLTTERDATFEGTFTQESVEAALDATAPAWRSWLGSDP